MRTLISSLVLMCGPAAALAQETDTSSSSELRNSDLDYFDVENRPESGKSSDADRSSIDPEMLDYVSVFGERRDDPRIAGSAHFLDTEALERFEQNDVHKVLSRVPGVYVRGEDGFGLRPNISMRGVDPNRSSKIVLLEDNVLLGPAPYSAPAAYYFPLITRMSGIEVFKGPAAIVTGPNTIGGAINFLTQPIPKGPEAYVDLAGGSDSFVKIHGRAGTGTDRWGFLAEVAHVQTAGFKDIVTNAETGFDRNDAETGFDRNDIMLKGRITTNPRADVVHELSGKFGWGSEVSNETYVGLTDADFARSPTIRYPSSQLARMDWDRLQFGLTHRVTAPRWGLTTTAYRHDFTRVWRRLNGFARSGLGGPTLNEAIAQDGALAEVLRGVADSTGVDDTLFLTFNDRSYVSQGIQTEASASFQTGPIGHGVRAGARFHFDRIERDHDEEEYAMLGGELRRTQRPRDDVTANFDRAFAGAFFLQDTMRLGRLTVVPAVRMEVIDVARELREGDLGFGQSGGDRAQTDVVVLPGIGASYGMTNELFVLAGIHRGFSPVAPSSARPVDGDEDVNVVDPELSWNLEGGLRYARPDLRVEAIGFANLYSNLVVNCTNSVSCPPELLDSQANLGEADTYGVELLVDARTQGWLDLIYGVTLAYTYTVARFGTDIDDAEIPRYSGAREGDRIPDIPLHIGSLTLSVGDEDWDVNLSVRGQDRTFDVPGAASDNLPDSAFTDAFAVLDASARYRATEWLELYASGVNLADARYVVGRRPFGARPGQTLTVFGGLKLRY